VALLGKGLLLLEAEDVPALPPPAAAALPVAVESRQLIAAQPDLASRMRAQMQASEDVRFAAFFPDAERSWPAWQSADWLHRAELGVPVARALMAGHAGSFLALWARDWAALVLYPNYWPAWSTSDLPRSAFLACRTQDNCWSAARYDIPLYALIGMLVTSVAGVGGGILVLLTTARQVLRRRMTAATSLFWVIAAVLQASVLTSSASESGFSRYTVALHVLSGTLLLWFATGFARRVQYWRRRQGPAAPIVA
jgi:hypothetical protein